MHGRPPVQWPALVGAIPPLVDQRVERPADRELADAVADPAGQTVVLCQVLSGLGGVGKTQTAASLARMLWDTRRLDLLVWVTATSRTAILTAFADAAARVTGIDDTDPDHAASRLLAWLAEPHQRRWLIILDNLDDPDDLTGLWPPTAVGGHTVVTSRRRDTALLAGRHQIDMDVFTAQQAITYLHSKLADQPQRLVQVDELAADLGYLPLALAQSMAYILDRGTRMTCAAYRQRLADRRRRLAELAPDALPDQHQATVAATWTLSIDRADQLAPAGVARPVLELCALLDSNAIPAELFTTSVVTSYCTQRIGRSVDIDDIDDAVHLLHRFNLLTVDEAAATVWVHALLQHAVRDATDPTRQRGLAHTAADALVEIWPEVERNAAHAQILRTNTAALHTTAGGHLWATDEGAHSVLSHAGTSLGDAGLVADAVDYYDRLHADAVRLLGPKHPNTLSIRNHLANWRGTAGDLAGAAEACEQLLTDELRILGPDDPLTLATRHNLAHWRGEAGDLAGAAEACEQLLTDKLRIFGPDHLGTLYTRDNLAMWQALVGDPAGAAEACEALLIDELRILGPDDPLTLATRNNLANWLGRAGHPARAAEACEALLNDELRSLGPDHPDTLTTRTNITYWRAEADGAAAAVVLLEPLVADTQRVLGPDHPLTLETRDQLARRRGEAGDTRRAIEMCIQLVADCLRVLGPDHRYTLGSRNTLANLRGQDGDLVGAVTTLEELLADQLRVLGGEHFYTLKTQNDLTNWRRQITDEPNDSP